MGSWVKRIVCRVQGRIQGPRVYGLEDRVKGLRA